VLKTYSGDHAEVYIAWGILVAINSYSLYTIYYDSVMQGKGLIKRSKQIQIVGQSVYLIVAVVLILLRFNLIAIVSAQALSVIIRRILAYRTIYTAAFRQQLYGVKTHPTKDILKPVYPNAVKVGLASLSEVLVNRSALILGGLFFSLNDVASYGLSLQVIMIIASISTVYFTSYQPKIAQYKVQNNNHAIALIYLKSCGIMFFTFIMGGTGLILFGDWALQIIKSQTPLLSLSFLIVMLVISYLDYNRGMAGWMLVAGNDVPFFKSNLITAGSTLCLLFAFLQYTDVGIWGLILAQGITQIIYQNWKWPMEVVRTLHIKSSDIKHFKIA
jgi:O-antigen/teichoic acid export membrane protein